MDYFLRNLKTMRGICNEYGAVFVAATMHYFQSNDTRDEFNRRLAQFFKEQKIPYFDAAAAIPKGR